MTAADLPLLVLVLVLFVALAAAWKRAEPAEVFGMAVAIVAAMLVLELAIEGFESWSGWKRKPLALVVAALLLLGGGRVLSWWRDRR